ncbi:UNVERIFIED_CONTAM: hypothetical protein GTU68_005023 [Idotea baltica]|nr:hypothetical protein [Idotea baltica]
MGTSASGGIPRPELQTLMISLQRAEF